MSDMAPSSQLPEAAQASAAPAAPSQEAQAAPARPRTSPTPVPVPVPVPLGDNEDALFGSLGLPFFFRHTPGLPLARATFWMAFVGIGAVVVINLLMMPYSRDTLIFSIRDALFGKIVPYESFDDGGISIFNQLFVIAIVLSNIVAPLFATYSLSSERVLGTMEFLRLSPMSTLSIVMGKMFAPAYTVHLISGAVLLVGSAIGVCSGLRIGDVATAVLVIGLSSATMHALGAFMAAYTTVFRGFGAVMGVLLLGYFISVMPFYACELGSGEFEFLAFASPWGAMRRLFWQEPYRYSTFYLQALLPAEFMGSAGWLLPYIVALYGFVFAMLVRGASRKLDKPEGSALPPVAWLMIWLFVVLTAFGTIPNATAQVMRYSPNRGWECAAAVMLVAGLAISVLALLDHPYHRETVLAEECDRAAGQSEKGRRRGLPMRHAFFVAGLTAASATVIVVLLWYILPFDEFVWSRILPIAAAPVVLAFLYAVILETTAMSFKTSIGRLFVAYAAMAVLFGAMLIPIVQVESAYSTWHRTMIRTAAYYAYLELPPSPTTKASYFDFNTEWRRIQNNPDSSIYLDGIDSKDSADQRRSEYQAAPAALFWRYHALAMSVCAAVFAVLIALLFVWRARVYAALRREAELAVGRAVAGAPRTVPAAAAATAIGSSP